MKTLNFLIFISLIAIILTLNKRLKDQEQTIKDNEEIINSIQGNSRKYIDIALKCNAEHK